MLRSRSLKLALLSISIFIFAFYLTTYVLLDNVYQYRATGAFFELLALPMLALLIIMPVITVAGLFHPSKKALLIASLFFQLMSVGIIVFSSS